MSDERPSEVLGGLPHTRPHRRSAKRGAPIIETIPMAPTSAPGATKRATRSRSSVRQPAQPAGVPPAPSPRRPAPAGRVDLLGSAVHVTAELAELGLSAGARALRGVVARLPRP